MFDGPAPLSQMLIANAETIEAVVEEHGASVVAEFFVNVGTGIAAMYAVSDIPQEEIAPIGAGEGN